MLSFFERIVPVVLRISYSLCGTRLASAGFRHQFATLVHLCLFRRELANF